MGEVERFGYGMFAIVLGVMAGTSFTCGTVQAEPIDGICQEKMRAIYEEVKTPFKYGVILAPEEGKMLDNPNVFRHGDKWYMLYIVFDRLGYETHLAESDDLLHWTKRGCVLPRGPAGAWDAAQADAGPSLLNPEWDGDNTLGKFDGKYWATYIGGAKTGYETDPLSIGVATTDDPSAAKPWERLPKPVLTPGDADARAFEGKTLFKSFVVDDPKRRLGARFAMYYNAKQKGEWVERIGLAVSDDMRSWRRVGKEPCVANEGALDHGLVGDPMVRKIGDTFVMFYFGYNWDRKGGSAFETFAASKDLVNWTKWTGPKLVESSESWDRTHAHKPWVIKHDGVVYHFYCAVGDRGRVLALATSADLKAVGTERVFRPARHLVGNTGLFPQQEIDRAAWITHPDDAEGGRGVRVLRFERTFRSSGETLELDVTADERFVLRIDGEFVCRGPHRGTVDDWTYQSYRVALAPGEHVVEATVWRLGDAAPVAQLSHRLGFCLKAVGPYDAELTTGRGAWRVCAIPGLRSIGKSGGPFGTGDCFEMTGSGFLDCVGTDWTTPTVIRPPMPEYQGLYGVRQSGWRLFPSQLPDQTETRIRLGRFVRGGELRFPMVVRPGESRRVLWDLGRYWCAYPEAIVSGGRGGRISWRWAEALRGSSADGAHKGLFKGNRNEWRGKSFDGFGDVFVLDGRARAVFQPPWFRCGRWCELKIEAGDDPVTIDDLSLIESRYPLACESVFETSGDDGLRSVQDICVRSMQMCAHEMLFDCPYYEQQMYPGDTRVQLNILSSMSSDEALIRRAIDLFALNRRRDGFVPFNFPSKCDQNGAAYSLCYLGMYHDYLMYHVNRDWLRARLPDLRTTLSAFASYERADGVLSNLPGWSFLDWVPHPAWKGGWAPGTRHGGANAELNLFYLSALQGAAEIEDAFGNSLMAGHWRQKASRLKKGIVDAFYDPARGLFASDERHEVYSEHAQCLALLTDSVAGEWARQLFEKLVSDKTLCPVSVYFSFYLFETYFKFGRADLFLDRLELWKNYVKIGATTCLEEPEYPGHDSRSDCHAWGAHPLWFLRTGVAGIRSAAPFYERVRIVPQPGGLPRIKASYPHPSGEMIRVELDFANGHARGQVMSPVPGEFVWRDRRVSIQPGIPCVIGP